MAKKDLKEYWQELAKKAGLSDEDMQAVLGVLGKENVSKAFSEGFVAVPDHHSTVDKVKQEAITEWKSKHDQIMDWYEKQGKPAYETNLRGIQQLEKLQGDLQKYRDTYGALDGADKGDQKGGGPGDALTRKEMEELLKQRDSAYVGLSKAMTRSAVDHLNRFKEPLDVDALEKFAVERGLPLDAAYKEFIAPKVEEQRTAEVEARVKAAREEGARDAISKLNLPDETVHKPSGFSPVWDEYKVDKSVDPDRASREAFIGGLNEAWQESATKKP